MGKYYVETGRSQEAKLEFRVSALAFFETNQYERCLDVMKDLAEFPPWDERDGTIYEQAVAERPDHLPREWTVRFALLRNAWNTIRVSDLQNRDFASLFRDHRNEPRLKSLIRECQPSDRASIVFTLPAFVGDYYLERKAYAEAVRLFLDAKDEEEAIKATEEAISMSKQQGGKIIMDVVSSWKNYDSSIASPKIKDLILLFDNPIKASTHSGRILSAFGEDIVRIAVDSSDADSATVLHTFDRILFRDNVEGILAQRYEANPIKVVTWYYNHNDSYYARTFAEKNLQKWSNEDLVHSIVGKFRLRFPGLLEEVERRSQLLNATNVCLDPNSDTWDLPFAEKLSDQFLFSNGAPVDLLEIWSPVLGDYRVQSKLKNVKYGASRSLLLLKLFSDPEETADKLGSQCMQTYDKELILKAVEAKKFSPDKRYNVLSRFDKKAFESEKPKASPAKVDKTKAIEAASPLFRLEDRVHLSNLSGKKLKRFNGVSGWGPETILARIECSV